MRQNNHELNLKSESLIISFNSLLLEVIKSIMQQMHFQF